MQFQQVQLKELSNGVAHLHHSFHLLHHFHCKIIPLTPKSQEKKKINKKKVHELLELVIRTILLFPFLHFGNQPFC